MARFYSLFSFALFVLLSYSSRGQIYAPEGINMPGAWNSWTNYPASGSVFRSGTHSPPGGIALITTGTRRWQTTLTCASSGGDVSPNTNYQFLYTSGPSNNPWQNAWRNTTVNMNSVQTYNFTGGGANNSITFGSAGSYTCNWKDNGYANTSAIWMYTSAAPVSISSVSQAPTAGNVGANMAVTVNLTFSTTPSPEEFFYVRYSTNNFSTSSSLVPVTVSGNTGSAQIPGQALNTTVTYYVLSSTVNNPSGDIDLQTLRFQNNSGLNYAYTTGAVNWMSTGSGNWNNPNSWSTASVPTSSSTIIIQTGHSLVLDTNVTISNLTIQPGATLTTADNQSRTLTVAASGVIQNNGSLLCPANSTLDFLGNGTILGNAVGFMHVSFAGGLTFPANTSVSGVLKINSGGYLNQNIVYQSGSTLRYTQNYGRYNEWVASTSGTGVPWNVQIDSGATVGMNGHTGEALIRGNLILNGVLGLSNQSGGNLVIAGNYVAGASSSLLTNTRTVIFRGSSPQTLSRNTILGELFTHLEIDNSNGVILASPVQVNGILRLRNGILNLAGNPLTMPNATTVHKISGSLSAVPSYTDSMNFIYGSGASRGVEWPSNYLRCRDLTLESGASLSNSSTLSVGRILDVSAGGIVQTSSGSIRLYGSLMGSNLSGGTLSIEGSNVDFTLSGLSQLGSLIFNRNAILSISTQLALTNDLWIKSGTVRASGARTLSFNGNGSSNILIEAGAKLEGTGVGTGNDLSVNVTNGTLNFSGAASSLQNADHKLFSLTVQSGAILNLNTGLLVQFGSFSVDGSLKISAGGTVENGLSGAKQPQYNANGSTLIYDNNLIRNVGAEWPITNGPNCLVTGLGSQITLQTEVGPLSCLDIMGSFIVDANTRLQSIQSKVVASSGSITVTSGHSLSITSGTLIIPNQGLILEDGASLLDMDAIPSGTGTVSGQVLVKRQGSTSNLRYNFWSSPVQNSTLSVLGSKDLREFDAVVQAWNPSGIGQNLSANTPMTVGKGYTASQSGLVRFVGNTNRSNFVYAMVQNPGTNDDWNLIGNPYPSGMDGIAFLADNATNINGSVYFWNTPFQAGVTNNFSGSDYVAKNLTSGNFTIGSAQGFFVEAISNQVQFSNTQRKAANSQFYRQLADQTERYYISLKSAQNDSTGILIGFSKEATDGYDRLWDARKFSGRPGFQFYSILNGENYEIQGLAPVDQQKTVNLGLQLQKASKYTFSIATIENSSGMEVWLEDRLTGTFTSLKSQNYTVNLNSGQHSSRFYLHYRSVKPVNPISTISSIQIWTSGDQLLAKASSENDPFTKIRVIDAQGRTVYQELLNQPSQQIQRSLDGLNLGIYMIEMETFQNKKIEKVFVSKP